MNHLLVSSIRNSFVDAAATIADDLKLRLAVAILERRTKAIVELSSKALAGPASQQQLQTMVDAADRSRMKIATRMCIPSAAIGSRCESLMLLRCLAMAKARPHTVVVPVVATPRG